MAGLSSVLNRTGFYSDDTPHIARRVLLLGATFAELAEILGTDENTIRLWKVRYPDFAEACKEGGAQACGKVAEALYRRATGYDYIEQQIVKTKDGDNIDYEVVEVQKHALPDVKACLAWLYNRDPLRWSAQRSGELPGAELLKNLKLVFVEPEMKTIEHAPGHAD